MIIVFFISGLLLDTHELARAKGHAWGVAYGFAATLLLTPLLAFAMKDIPLEPREFSMGEWPGWLVGWLAGWLVGWLVGWWLVCHDGGPTGATEAFNG